MGMTASQARLLCITARMHDVEYQAQAIQHAKLQLATQSDQAYQEYVEALDAQTLVLRTIDGKSGAQSSVPATFNNLCSRSKMLSSTGVNYALKDINNRLIVEQDIYNGYINFDKTKSAEAFAFYMINGSTPDDVEKAEINAWDTVKDYKNRNLDQAREALETYVETHREDDPEGEPKGELTTAELYSFGKNDEEYQELLNRYRDELYKSYGADVSKELNLVSNSDDDIDLGNENTKGDFDYYVAMYNQIQANGGNIISITQFDGFNGNAANDSEWLTTMVECGQISVSIVEKDKKDKDQVVFKGTSPGSDTSLSYSATSTVDSTAIKKAEAKYENKLREIQKKDKKFDLTLQKLETERNALDKQIDGLKEVIKKNVERTFGIFS